MPTKRQPIPFPADWHAQRQREAKARGMALGVYIQHLVSVALAVPDNSKDTLSLDDLERVAAGMLQSATRSIDVKHLTEVAERLTALRERHGLLVPQAAVYAAQEAQAQAIDDALSPAQAAVWGVPAAQMDDLRRAVQAAVGVIWA